MLTSRNSLLRNGKARICVPWLQVFGATAKARIENKLELVKAAASGQVPDNSHRRPHQALFTICDAVQGESPIRPKGFHREDLFLQKLLSFFQQHNRESTVTALSVSLSALLDALSSKWRCTINLLSRHFMLKSTKHSEQLAHRSSLCCIPNCSPLRADVNAWP